MCLASLKKIVLLLLSLTLLACGAAQKSQLYRGKNNFEAGYYREAFRQLLPLASEGNREAEYAVGFMYYYGYGVSQDTETGVFWIKRSAAQGDELARRALKTISVEK